MGNVQLNSNAVGLFLTISLLISVLGHYPGYLYCRSIRFCPGICLQGEGKQRIASSVVT